MHAMESAAVAADFFVVSKAGRKNYQGKEEDMMKKEFERKTREIRQICM